MARLAALWGFVAFVALLLLATPAPAASMSFIPGADSDAAASAELMEVDAVTDAAAVSESHSHHAHAQAHAADAAAVAESEGAAEAAPGRAPAVAKNFFAHKRGKGHAFYAHDKSSKGRRMYAHHKKPQGFFAHAQKPQGFFSHVQPGTMQYRHVKGKSDRVPGGAAAPAEAEEKQDPHHKDRKDHHKDHKEHGHKTHAHADKAADKAHHKGAKKAGKAPDVWDHKLKNPNAKDAFKKAAGKPVSLTEAERWDTKVAAEYAAEQARIKAMSQKLIPASNPPKSVFNVAPGLKKIHVEVQTVAHGGAGANELLRIEDQFDHTHARIMSGLSRLLLRVNRAHEAETKRMQKEDQKDAEATIKLMRAKLAKRAEKKKAEAAAAKKKAQAPAPAAAAAPKKK